MCVKLFLRIKARKMSKHSTVLTFRPYGEDGVNVRLDEYLLVKNLIMDCLKKRDMTHIELTDCVANKMNRTLSSPVDWHVEAVRSDLEARGILHRIDNDEAHLCYQLTSFRNDLNPRRGLMDPSGYAGRRSPFGRGR